MMRMRERRSSTGVIFVEGSFYFVIVEFTMLRRDPVDA
jgi:hypothetical protein